MKYFRIQLIIFACLFGSCSSTGKYANSDHYKDGVFFNPNPTKHLSFFSIFKHIVFGRNGKWTDYVEIKSHYISNKKLDTDEVRLTFVGHASVLIEFSDKKILTDPVWSDKVGPFSWAGPRRAHSPGIPFERLPKIDVVLVSHNHFDHMDLPTLKKLSARDRPKIIVPLGNQDFLNRQGIENVAELDWWESKSDGTAQFQLTPAQHNSGRGLFDRDKTLWGSFFIFHNNIKIYFSGDTAFENHFFEIQSKLGSPDVALIPIGAYLPKERMDAFHLSPSQAIDAFIHLKSTYMIPIHYDCFQLSNEDYGQPIKDFNSAIQNRNLDTSLFKLLKPGQSWVFKKSTRS